jgi:hypothetical protein
MTMLGARPLVEEDIRDRTLEFLSRGTTLSPKVRRNIREAYASGKPEDRARAAGLLLESITKQDSDLAADLEGFEPNKSARVTLVQRTVFEALDWAVIVTTQPILVVSDSDD